MKNKEDTGIDLLKFIAAFLILMSHMGFWYSYAPLWDFYFINISFRWCIPFFFICTGFYLKDGFRKALKYEVRLLLLYIVWNIFYIVLDKMDVSFISLVKYIRFGAAIHLWYFPALICGVLFVYLLTKILPDCISCIIVISMYIIALFGDCYANVMPMGALFADTIGDVHKLLFEGTSRNGLLFCSLFIWIGRMIKKYEKKIVYQIKKVSLFWTVFPIILNFMFLALEIHLYKTYGLGIDANVLISIVPLALLMFLLGLRIEQVNTAWGVMMRKCSVIIYTVHIYYISRFNNLTGSSIVNCLIIYGISLVTALVIAFLGKYIKILKYLY